MTHTQSTKPTGNWLERLVARVDMFQQKRHALSFPYSVIKKYGDDDAGHEAALITYYGFLSLFPLLLVATSVVDRLTQNNPELRARLLGDINSHLSVFGSQLQSQIHASNRTGVALALGLLVALYGTRGVAHAVRGALDHAWATPKSKRSGFPKNALKSFALLLGAGLGLVLTTTLAGYATSALGGHFWLTRIVPLAINAVLLYVILMYVFTIGPSRRRPRSDLRLGAIVASVGLLVLQTLGTYLVAHQLQNLRGLYGQFALVLSLMFWLYLQAQVLVYAIEINVVHAYKLWPRSITNKPLTRADKEAYRLYAEKEAYRPKNEETIAVTFDSPD
ncbi:MAG TPA: YihY/virulence factor BrkB family protein [Candidatus Saccharimonadales bacterium]|nr:YihY/virulence factor BrkB family protein [Candidatus Saccharimonadales bacterium]